MEELSERELAQLERLGWTQRATTTMGLVLSALGAAYLVWGIYLFDWRVDPREQSTFDQPIARMGFLYDRYQRTLDKIRPETPVEALLLDSMKRGMVFSAGVMVLMLRVYVGTLVLLMGLIALTVVVERRRLLRVIEKLRA